MIRKCIIKCNEIIKYAKCYRTSDMNRKENEFI